MRITTGPNGEAAVFEGDPGQYRFDILPPPTHRDAENQEVALSDSVETSLAFRVVKRTARAVVAVLEVGTDRPLANVDIEVTRIG